MKEMTYGNYPDLSCIKKILVIKLRHHGDVLLTSPLFSFLKQAMPSAKIDAFLYKETLPMLEGDPAIDQFLLYDRKEKSRSWFKGIQHELSLLMQIANASYDLVLNLTEGDRGAIATALSRAGCKVGLAGKRGGVFSPKRIYTHQVKISPFPRHTVEKHLDFARRIGLFPQEGDKTLSIAIPDSIQKRIQDRLQQEKMAAKSYVLIHPSSRWKFKTLSIEQMQEIVQLLIQAGKTIVLTSGPDPDEIDMVSQIVSGVLPSDGKILNLAGTLSLKELAAWILHAEGVICVDSLPLHLCSCTKTPVVALFGPTSEQTWGPWQHPYAHVMTLPFSCRPCYQDGCGGSKKSDCLLSLSPQEIVSAFLSLFKS